MMIPAGNSLTNGCCVSGGTNQSDSSMSGRSSLALLKNRDSAAAAVLPAEFELARQVLQVHRLPATAIANDGHALRHVLGPVHQFSLDSPPAELLRQNDYEDRHPWFEREGP